MPEKMCFRCGETKPLSEFYVHPDMADGHLGKCKACTRGDVATRYRATRSARRAYERKRAQDPERKIHAAEYQRRARKRSPEKDNARKAVRAALLSGDLKRMPCELCGDPRSQAHHADYSRPLDVEWLCFRCHREHAHHQIVTQGDT